MNFFVLGKFYVLSSSVEVWLSYTVQYKSPVRISACNPGDSALSYSEAIKRTERSSDKKCILTKESKYIYKNYTKHFILCENIRYYIA